MRLTRVVEAIAAGGDTDSANYPQWVCAAGVELLGVTGAGLTLMAKGQLSAVWASDATAQRVEDLQFSLGEGPAVDAHADGAPAIEPDLAESGGRWPFFCPAAQDLGIQAVFSFPLQIGVINLGALNFYRDQPGLLSAVQLADALVLADVATQDLVDLKAEGALSLPLAERFADRARVHQATGMVAEQTQSDMASALAQIRGYAFANDESIFEVADSVLARRLRLADRSTL